jgi:hypothetical protein
MADARLRALERAAADGGEREEINLLRERMRLGVISRGRVGLAAYCGSSRAREALGLADPPPHSHRFDLMTGVPHEQAWPHCGCSADGRTICAAHGPTALLEDFVTGLFAWGEESQVRAGLAVAKTVRDHLVFGTKVPALLGDVKRRVNVGIQAITDWLDCPCDEHWEACRKAEAEIAGQGCGWMRRPLAMILGTKEWEHNGAYTPLMHLIDACHYAVTRGANVPERTLRDAICRDLIKWALS